MAVLPGVKSKADIEKAWSTVDRNGASVRKIVMLFDEDHPTQINRYIISTYMYTCNTYVHIYIYIYMYAYMYKYSCVYMQVDLIDRYTRSTIIGDVFMKSCAFLDDF